jgi:hypothetical protein
MVRLLRGFYASILQSRAEADIEKGGGKSPHSKIDGAMRRWPPDDVI